MVMRQEIADETWAVLEPLFPKPKGRGRPMMDMRSTVEGIAWRFRTGAPWPGCAGAVRSLELDLSTLLDLVGRRDLGAGPGHGPDLFGRGRSGRLDRLGGLHDHPGPPTRRDTQARHRGPDGTTGSSASRSRLTTRSVGPEAE